jgi:uncharacterized protein
MRGEPSGLRDQIRPDVAAIALHRAMPRHRLFVSDAAAFSSYGLREVHNMLALKPNCECCNRDLPPDSREAMICSFECTFCSTCATQRLGLRCPNCAGEFVRRPVRPSDALLQYPASRDRTFRPHGCVS